MLLLEVEIWKGLVEVEGSVRQGREGGDGSVRVGLVEVKVEREKE
jgi:hypothetical protein